MDVSILFAFPSRKVLTDSSAPLYFNMLFAYETVFVSLLLAFSDASLYKRDLVRSLNLGWEAQDLPLFSGSAILQNSGIPMTHQIVTGLMGILTRPSQSNAWIAKHGVLLLSP